MPEQVAELLTLWRAIPGRTCSVANYLEYLDQYWSELAVFAVLDDEHVVGFTQIEKPSLLDPKIAWLPFSYLKPQYPRKYAQKALGQAIEWAKRLGASTLRMQSVRHPAALKRAYNFVPSEGRFYDKDISDGLDNSNNG